MIDDAPAVLAKMTRARARTDGTPVVVGIAGAVACGKSTLAASVAAAATVSGASTEVVATDGFLLSNAELAGRGLLDRKGFPESYDVSALHAFVDLVHSGAPEVVVRRYSHEVYDVGEPEALRLGDDAVVIVEGVNALGALEDRLDLGIYLHADEHDLESWYVARFLKFCAEAADDPTSFYRRFAGMTTEEVEDLASQTWRGVNLVNLRDHIAPTRALADCIVIKASDHSVTDVEVRPHTP